VHRHDDAVDGGREANLTGVARPEDRELLLEPDHLGAQVPDLGLGLDERALGSDALGRERLLPLERALSGGESGARLVEPRPRRRDARWPRATPRSV
jgi:hypothetical protein